MAYDLLVKDCRLVRTDTVVACSIAVRDGRVAGLLEPGEEPPARRVIDAGGRHVIPGLIDTHVHFGNAGNPFEQDCRTESRAAATGGVTTMLVYTFASSLPGQPPSPTVSYDNVLSERRRAAEEHSVVDMMFHLGILHPAHITQIDACTGHHGVRSFKAFMRGTNALGDGHLFEFFSKVARVPGGLALVHCENHALIEWAEHAVAGNGSADLRTWSERAPIFGELESIQRAITLAGAAGVRKLVILHLGIGSGTEFLRQKQWGELRVMWETCPHYLLLDQDQALGVAAKVGPPLRDRSQLNALWDRLLEGSVDFIGSDQLAFTRKIKGEDLWKAPPGMTGGMPMILPVLLTEGVRKRNLPMTRLVEVTSTRAAQAFGLYPRKGTIEVGSDADMVILDEDRKVQVSPAVLNTFSDYTPYDGYEAHGWAGVTIAGGRVLYADGELVDSHARGRVLVPSA